MNEAKLSRQMRGRWVLAGAVVLAAGRLAAAPAGLVVHYDFEQVPADGLVADRSGSKNDGRLGGGAPTKEGKKGGGLECRAGQGGVRPAGNPALDLSKGTLTVWFKAGKGQAGRRPVLGVGGFRMFLECDAQGAGKLAVELDGGGRVAGDPLVTDSGWHFAAATFDGGQIKLYLDGKPQQQPAPGKRSAGGAAGLLVGMDEAPAGAVLDGTLDEVMVFDRALSAEELSTLGSAIDPKIVPPARVFTKAQIGWQIRALEVLYDEGLLTDDYFTRKVRELEALVVE